jgi:glycosyltransferase involved in cell wall biosynthesis
MNPATGVLSLTYSLADQSFVRTKSIGILNVSLELLQALAQRPDCAHLTVLANYSLREQLALPPACQIEHHDFAADSGLGRMWWDQFGAYAAARRTGHDWLLLPKGFASFARRCPVRLAVFVHDVMQDHYDHNYPGVVSGLEAAYFRAAFRASLRHAEIVFTPSEFTRREIERVARENKLRSPRLVCCGEGFARPAAAPVAERRDVVVLAGRMPHKLTRCAVEFLSRWQRGNSFAEQMHWVGSFPEKLELPPYPGWQRHARLPEAEFRALLARARAVLFFSDYEGFGRPPVEAVLAGACPVYSDLPVTHEVMNDCGAPFENASYESFAAALDRALRTRPEQLLIWADGLLVRHNWNAVANRIVTALSVTA